MNRDIIIRMVRERKVRLVVHGGTVVSNFDRQKHYITPMDVARLYNLPIDLRVTFYPSGMHEFLGYRDQPTDIHLHPRNNGKYDLEVLQPQGGWEAVHS